MGGGELYNLWVKNEYCLGHIVKKNRASKENKHILCLQVWKAMDHTVFLHLAIFGTRFRRRLINIFLT